MANFLIGVNMEFVRSEDKPFAEGVEIAAQLGYQYIEPMVHNGRELLSEAGYFHSVSMHEDPLWMKEICERHGVKLSGLSAHCPLTRPEISVNYLTQAVRFAADAGAPIVNTDEGPKLDWMQEDMAWTLMEYTLTQVVKVAERHGIIIAVEDHQIFSQQPGGLMRIANLVDSPNLQINYDAGNAYIAGNDPYEMLEEVRDRVYHVHAKDIGGVQAEERGQVTGVPVGVACGEGVIDWKRTLEILQPLNRDIALSVECGTIEQAKNSIAHLKDAIASL